MPRKARIPKKRRPTGPEPRVRPSRKTSRLTHLDDRGQAHMVDVAAKPETSRVAVASAAVKMSAATLKAVTAGGHVASAKGDVFAVARMAALAALKRTPDWIPLAHPVRVVGSHVDLQADRALPGIRVRVQVHAVDRTGVEMEAMVGASAAALSVYDMVKALQRDVEIVSVRLEEKKGGRSGHWRRGASS